jgi:hypothetical protein
MGGRAVFFFVGMDESDTRSRFTGTSHHQRTSPALPDNWDAIWCRTRARMRGTKKAATWPLN